MSTVVKTCEEFSTRRKIRYGAGSSTSDTFRSSGYGTLTPSSINASLSPHKSYYGRDQDDVPSYFIEFNIGNFQFDEITIRTEDHHRLIVQGKSKYDENSDELSREFTRDFTLPSNVDQYSIRAQLEETTRQLTLIGQLTETAINSLNATTESELKGSSLSQTSAALAAVTSAMSSSSISSSSSTANSAYTSSSTSAMQAISSEKQSAFSASSSSGMQAVLSSERQSAFNSSSAMQSLGSSERQSAFSASSAMQALGSSERSAISSSSSSMQALGNSERQSTFSSSSKLGSVVETRQSNGIEYEIYLGNELRDGQVNLEMVGYNTLIVRVIRSDWDKNGDFSLELKRQIKLPYGSNPQNSEHGILPSGVLLVKVPFK